MDQAKSDYFSSQILEAIETVAKSVTSKLEYDQTIICTITDVSNKDNGEYTVSDGSSEFPAYSADTNYTKGTVVYVLVPKGNYDNQKTIVGKYVKESETALTYIPPLEQIIELATLEGVRPEDSVGPDWGLAANSDGENQTTYVEIGLNKSEADFENGFFNCICVSGDFRTNLSAYNIKSGTYGLLLQVDKKNTTTNEITTSYYNFNSKQMYGDIYNFNIGINQQYTFDLSQEFQNEIDYRINDIKLFFYESGDFTKLGGDYIEPATIGNKFIKNLFISNVTVHLGLAASDIQSECVKLYTNNGTIFKGERSGGTDKENKKAIQLKWFYPRSGSGIGTYAVIDTLEELTNTGLDVSIYWYKYKIDSAVNDPLAGVFWEPIYKYNDKKYETYQIIEETDENKNKQEKIVYGDISFYISDTNENSTLIIANTNDDGFYSYNNLLYFKDGFIFTKNSDKYNVKIGKRYGDLETEVKNSFPFEIDYIPNKILSREKIKVILIKNNFGEEEQKEFNGKSETSKTKLIYQDQSVTLETDELVFENPDGAQALSEVDFIQNVSFEFIDGTNGVYKVYNDVDNKVINWENTKERTITIKFDNLSSKDLTEEQDTVTAQWTFPSGNTMIAHSPTADRATIEGEPADVGDRKGSFSSTYSIGDFYSPMYNNNTIKCSLTKNGKTYNYEVTLVFGPTGSNGTSYTLNLSLGPKTGSTQPVPCFTKDSSGEFSVTAQVFDEHGKEISNNNGLEFEWSWVWRYKNNVLEKDIAIGGSSNKITLEDGNHYGIIKCKTSKILSWIIDTNKVALTSYLPIGLRSSNAIATYKGTNKIIYDADGLNPIYEKEHKLYNSDETEIPSISWNIYAKDEDGNNITGLLAGFKDNNVLVPSVAYFSEYELTPFYITGIGTGYNYIQPIVYMQNAYGNSALNNWDGQQKIDKDNNIIYSATGIFGLKNNTNGFDGVVLGKTSYKAGSKTDTTTGVVGLNNGAATFGFSVDGSAFIGAAGKGRIEFNPEGNKAIIQSYQYSNSSDKLSGSYWNLTDGEFRLNGQNGSMSFDFAAGNANIGGRFIIEQNKTSVIDFQTNYDSEKKTYTYTALIQSPDFSDKSAEEKGMQFDLINSSFKIYGGNKSKMKILFEAGDENNDGQFKIYQGDNTIFNFETSTDSKNETKHTSIIQSTGFVEDTTTITNSTGSQWNLQEGTFKLYGGNSSAMKFLLDSSENGKFHIYSAIINNGKVAGYNNILKFDDNDLYIQSVNFTSSDDITKCIGGQWNLKGGTFKLYGDKGSNLKFLLDTSGKFIIYKGSEKEIFKEIFQFDGSKSIIQTYGFDIDTSKLDNKDLIKDILNLYENKDSSIGKLQLDFDLGRIVADRALLGRWYLDSETLSSKQSINKDGTFYVNCSLQSNANSNELIEIMEDLQVNSSYEYNLSYKPSFGSVTYSFGAQTNVMWRPYDNTEVGYTVNNNAKISSITISCSDSNSADKSYTSTVSTKILMTRISGNCYTFQAADFGIENSTGLLINQAVFSYDSNIVSFTIKPTAEKLKQLFCNFQGLDSNKLTLAQSLVISAWVIDAMIKDTYVLKTDLIGKWKNTKPSIILGIEANKFNDYTYSGLVETPSNNFNGLLLSPWGSIDYALGGNNQKYFIQTGQSAINFRIKSGNADSFNPLLQIERTDSDKKIICFLQEKVLVLGVKNHSDSEQKDIIESIGCSWDYDKNRLSFSGETNIAKGALGSFYLNGDKETSGEFWNNSLYTISEDKSRIGFLRAIGSTSDLESNVFIGSRISGDYKFYIQFNGNAGFKKIKCDELSCATVLKGSLSTSYLSGTINGSQIGIIDGNNPLCLKASGSINNITQNSRTTAPMCFTGGGFTHWLQDITMHNYNSSNTNNPISWSIGVNSTNQTDFHFFIALNGNKANYYPRSVLKLTSKLNAESPTKNYPDTLELVPFQREFGTYNSVSSHANSYLGSKNYHWKYGYIDEVTEENDTSDSRLKIKQSANLLDKYLQLYDNLNTSVYKYKNIGDFNEHSRTHCGFIAQEVEKAMLDIGLTNEDFAAIQIEEVPDDANKEILEVLSDKKRYYLNYNEFHGLHLLKNQQQDRRIEALEQEVKQLREELNRVKGV